MPVPLGAGGSEMNRAVQIVLEGRIHVGPLKTDGYAEARGEDGRQRIKGKQKGRKW